MEILNHVSAFIDMIAAHPILSVLTGLGLIDALLRRKETEKALSILIGVQALCRAVDKLIDKVIPHKLAAPVLPPTENSEGK